MERIANLKYTIASLKEKSKHLLINKRSDVTVLEADLEDALNKYLRKIRDDEAIHGSEPIFNDHIIQRLVAIANAETASKELMRSVYARDSYFLKSVPMPPGDLNDSQKKEVEEFWRPYSFAYKNNPATQRYFSLMSGRFDPTYVGFGLHCHFLKRFWENNRTPFINDKNNFNLIFPEAKIPEIVFRRKRGMYFDADMKLQTVGDVWQRCLDALYGGSRWDLILKPAASYSGAGLLFLRKANSQAENKAVFDSMDKNKDYICQRVVRNHQSWRTTESSKGFNVARVNTLCYKGEVKIVSSYLKMAPNDDLEIVNIGTGALGVRILDDGSLDSRAIDFYKSVWRYDLPNGEQFAGKKLYNYENVKETVLGLATRIPECPMIAWDVAVDDDGDVSIIELNPSGGTEGVQVHGQHPFGGRKVFKEILDEYLIKRFYLQRSNWEWDYWEFKNTVSIHKYEGLSKVIFLPKRINGKRVTIVHDYTFSGKNLEKIVVPHGWMAIQEKAFENCGSSCRVYT